MKPRVSQAGVVGALVFGLFATVLAILQQVHEPGLASDLDQVLFAARALLGGENPYDAVGPGRPFEWAWPLYYPLPTILFTVPLAPFPFPVARVLFSGVGAALLGYALTRRGEYWRLPFCLGAAFLMCLWRTQWAFLLTAGFFLPLAAVFLITKPNIGLAVVAGARTGRELKTIVGGAAAIIVASLLVRPDWPLHWLGAVRSNSHFSAPVTNPGGFLLLLALLRWRRPEARVLAVLTLMPQTPQFYDLVPLIVVPRTLREVSILTLLTSLLFWVTVALGPAPDFHALSRLLGRLTVWIVYLPALVMLLRRPNVSEPDPVEHHPGRGFRAWIETLPRLDAWLLIVNAAFAAAFIWAFLVTRRV